MKPILSPRIAAKEMTAAMLSTVSVSAQQYVLYRVVFTVSSDAKCITRIQANRVCFKWPMLCYKRHFFWLTWVVFFPLKPQRGYDPSRAPKSLPILNWSKFVKKSCPVVKALRTPFTQNVLARNAYPYTSK